MSVIARLTIALRRLRAAEDGIAMVYAMAAMVVVLGLTGAALTSVGLDTQGTAIDTSQKQAYKAAEAGIQRYLFQLNTDNTYWTQCVPAGTNWIVNTGATGTPQPVPGSSTEKYLVTLLPAVGQNTYSQCSTSDPVGSMIQASGSNAGTLRISSTGYAGNVKRTVVAAIRQQNFLDYAYFTDFETSDPYVQVDDAFASTGGSDTAIEPPDECAGASGCGGSYQTALSNATKQCNQYRYQGRESSSFFSNTYTSGKSSYSLKAYCTDIQFINNDQIKGPFHSNDSVLMCGNPTFGRPSGGGQTFNDSVEFGGDKNVYPKGWTPCSSGSTGPTVNGVLTPQDTHLNMPSILALANVAGTSLAGTTCLNLTSTGIQVSDPSAGQSCPTTPAASMSTKTIPYPSNGVLYVDNDNTQQCNYSYDADAPLYTATTSTLGCGTVYVQGTAVKPLTIGAAQDIVIDGNVAYPSPNTTAGMLGLIANGFIRVYHPVVGGVCTSNGAANASGYTPITQISAAMLSLQHSFIVDDYSCGANLGTLNVYGAIAQKYRGTVGAGSAGYTKNYVYDPRLQYSEPPHFLAPTNGAYAIAYQTECDTTASCSATS